MTEALGNLGALYGQQGKLAQAQRLLRLAIESNAGYERGYVNLGLILAAEGRLNEARTQIHKALAISATDPLALHAMEAIDAQQPSAAKH
jgi:Flp pilus assembly protein TadD